MRSRQIAVDKSPKACPSGKNRYKDHPSAAAALRYTKESALKEGRVRPLRTYQCAMCKGWHLTSKREEDAGRRNAQVPHRDHPKSPKS